MENKQTEHIPNISKMVSTEDIPSEFVEVVNKNFWELIDMENKQTLEEAAKKYINLPLNREMDEEERYFNSRDKEYDAFIAGAKWQSERMYSEDEVPTELEPVLAKINHQNDLGTSQWYEVAYYADDKWHSYSGSKTFQNG